ncbi:hypothetical protein Asera_00380 [Actinocatenispora sera]|uniref:Uncharacterized protein n=1 Tax=Actinocatenispora sera TaxID=390989 RepID=A0A810KSC1_9ACTN|nr:hypothetical protein Asera_00380 [Actinocatenispora sera]
MQSRSDRLDLGSTDSYGTHSHRVCGQRSGGTGRIGVKILANARILDLPDRTTVTGTPTVHSLSGPGCRENPRIRTERRPHRPARVTSPAGRAGPAVPAGVGIPRAARPPPATTPYRYGW